MLVQRLPKVLAIDDDRVWLSQIPLILEDICEVTVCPSIDEGIAALASQFFDIVLLDLNFEGDERTGLDVFRRISATDNMADVVVISGETDRSILIHVMNAGITKFITKPTAPDLIRQTVRSILEKREVRFRAINLATVSGNKDAVHLIGHSAPMIKLKEEIQFAVSSGAKDILLLGETGTGKEVVARLIVSLADPAKRFIPIHCGAISDGIAESELFGHVKGAFTGADKDRVSAFEAVSGGFIFFDEIGEMPMNQQAKLLRVIQERKITRVGSTFETPVNFRSISATHVDFKKAIAAGRFREDLYYRIAKTEIRIPSLRDRTEDIPELVIFFLNELKQGDGVKITDEALNLLQAFSWPGNVRQLQAAIESMASRCSLKVIREGDVCRTIPEIARLSHSKYTRPFLGREGASLIASERKRYQRALSDANWNRDKTARMLNVSRATFFRRAKELGLVGKSRVELGRDK